MTVERTAAAAVALVTGGAAALVGFRLLVASPPDRLRRLNYRNRSIPAILGAAVVVAGLLGAVVALLLDPGRDEVHVATLATIAILGLGGVADDLRGDEGPRGFRGHLLAAARGRVTGGLVKIVAGLIAGGVAGSIVASGRTAVEIALLVALGANFVNLLDRAPGRAVKVSLAIWLPLLAFGAGSWGAASAGLWGGAAAVLPLDLRERAMLGDTGANPLGGTLGLGLGLALAEPARLVALVLLVGLNAASEGWSFSAAIERNRALRWIDRAGRVRD